MRFVVALSIPGSGAHDLRCSRNLRFGSPGRWAQSLRCALRCKNPNIASGPTHAHFCQVLGPALTRTFAMQGPGPSPTHKSDDDFDPPSSPRPPPAMLGLRVCGCSGSLLQSRRRLEIPCPASNKDIWDAVETALGQRRIHFDLLCGANFISYSPQAAWWRPEELDLTVVKRRPEVVSQLVALGHILNRPSSAAPRKAPIQSMDILRAAVSYWSGNILCSATLELRCNRDAVLFAVQNSGGALHWASEELKDDRGVVEAAVRQWGGALTFASERLKDDADLVGHAIDDDAMYGSIGTERARNQLRAEGRIISVHNEPPSDSQD